MNRLRSVNVFNNSCGANNFGVANFGINKVRCLWYVIKIRAFVSCTWIVNDRFSASYDANKSGVANSNSTQLYRTSKALDQSVKRRKRNGKLVHRFMCSKQRRCCVNLDRVVVVHRKTKSSTAFHHGGHKIISLVCTCASGPPIKHSHTNIISARNHLLSAPAALWTIRVPSLSWLTLEFDVGSTMISFPECSVRTICSSIRFDSSVAYPTSDLSGTLFN